ncbi:MAG: amino acid adenylation domain-containing protein, partial [Acidobacteriota bacterium]
MFDEQAAQCPDAVALCYGDEQLSYQALKLHSDRLARLLRRRGIQGEARVGISMGRCLEMPQALLGVLKAGGAYLPLDPDYPRERREFMIEDSGCRLLLRRGKPHRAQSEDAERRREDLSADRLAYVMYTSGSTGRPKGVAVAHRSIVRLVRNTGYLEFSAQQVFLQFAPISFDAASLEIWGPLLNGGRLALFPDTQPSLYELGTVLARQQVDTLWLTAGLFQQMVEENLEGLRPVRQLLAGGDVLSPQHVRRALRDSESLCLINGYGPTENTTFTCCHPMRDARDIEAAVPIGEPIRNTEAYLADRHGRLAPMGAVGELWIGGAGLARSYLGRPARTAASFRPDPFSGRSGSRLYRSGDLVRWRGDGVLNFLGRIDSQVKIRGFRVEPGEIEAVLLKHPAVQQAAVLASPDPSGSKRLVAYIVEEEEGDNRRERRGRAQRGAEKSSQRPPRLLSASSAVHPPLPAFLSQHLPEYMVPSFFLFLDQLPLTPNGKLDRRRLPTPEASASPQAGFTAPRNPVEARLAGIWIEVLGVERVGFEDNFFELGGHSLMATQVISKIRRAFGQELPLRAMFEAPRLEQLAQRIESDPLQAPPPPIRPVKRKGDLPLSFAQQRLWFLDRLIPGNPFYNIPAAWELKGNLDVGALRWSLDQVVQRHESLRTRFPSREGRPCQEILPFQPRSLPLVDLSGLPQAHRSSESNRLVKAEALRPFDLARGPLFRTSLVLLEKEGAGSWGEKAGGWGDSETGSRFQVPGSGSFPRHDPQSPIFNREPGTRNPEPSASPSQLTTDNCPLTTDPSASLSSCLLPPASCLLLITLHHVIADGWSMGVLFEELTAFYSGSVELAVRSSERGSQESGVRDLEIGSGSHSPTSARELPSASDSPSASGT